MGTTKAQMKATAKYKAKAYKRIPLDVRNDEYIALKNYTNRTGESVNGFIRRIISEKIAQDKAPRAAEEIGPDEWDLEMIKTAQKENDGITITLDEMLKKDGLTYADLQN